MNRTSAEQACGIHTSHKRSHAEHAKALAEEINSQRSSFCGMQPLQLYNPSGMLRLESSQMAGSYLVASRRILPGQLLGVAECGVKLLDAHSVSTTESTDMLFR